MDYLNKETNNNYSSKTLTENYNKILITLFPIIPHFASECMQLNQFEINQSWPDYDKEKLIDENTKIVVQINGKKRDLVEVKRDISEENLIIGIKNNNKISKYLNNKKILKVIFIKNKIINIIIQ